MDRKGHDSIEGELRFDEAAEGGGVEGSEPLDDTSRKHTLGVL